MDIHINLDDVFKWIGYITCAWILGYFIIWPLIVLAWMSDPIGSWKWNRATRKRRKEHLKNCTCILSCNKPG